MQVAFVSEVFLPAVDGVVTRLTRPVEELARAGDEVLMIAPTGGQSSYAGAPVLGIAELRMPLYPPGTRTATSAPDAAKRRLSLTSKLKQTLTNLSA